MLAIMGAFEQEIADLRRQMAIEESVTGPRCRLYGGKLRNRDILLVQTGMGRERAENATRFALERYPVTAIISIGFAGALAPELNIGDVVVCSKLYFVPRPEEEEQALEPYAADANLLALASQGTGDTAIPFSIGRGVTVLQLNADSLNMQELSDTLNVHIIDMESYWIAGIASTWKIPFIAIRSISDTIRESVQPFDRILDSGGELLWKKAVLCFLLHPWYLKNVFTLYKNTRPAKRNLAALICHLVAKI